MKTGYFKVIFVKKIISLLGDFLPISITTTFLILQLFAAGCGMSSQSQSTADSESSTAPSSSPTLTPTPTSTPTSSPTPMPDNSQSPPTNISLSGVTSPGSSATPTIQVDGVEIGSLVSIYTSNTCFGPSFRGSVTAVGTSAYITSTALSGGDGVYSYYADTTDSSGNTSPCSSMGAAYVLDSTEPTLTGLANDATPAKTKTWSWGCSDVGAANTCSYRFAIDQIPTTNELTAWSSYGSGTSASQNSGNGNYYLHVQAKDTAGNTTNPALAENSGGHYSAVLDNAQSAPNGLSLIDPASSPGTDTTPSLRISGVANNDLIEVLATPDCTGTVLGLGTSTEAAFDVILNPLADGSYVFRARSTDSLGNVSSCSVATSNYVLDTAGPIISSVTMPTNAIYPQGATLDFVVHFNELVNLTDTGNIYQAPRLVLDVGGASKYANYLSGSGTTDVSFRYTVGPGENDTNGIAIATTIDLNSGTIKDALNNNATLTFTVPSLAGVVVDTQPPTDPTNVNDAISYNSLIASTGVSFTASSDASGIARYEYALGTSSGGTQIKSWTSINLATSFQATGLSLNNGTTYYASVRAIDLAGNTSGVALGNGWFVDVTAPSLPTGFLDGVLNFSPTDFIATSDSPSMSWGGGTDVGGSGVMGYQIAIGDTLGDTNILSWTSVGDVVSNLLSGLTLTGSQRYFASVRAMDNAGNVSAAVNGDGWWNLRKQKLSFDTSTPLPRMISSNANFGFSTSISEDGNTMVVGVPGDNLDASGANYIYHAGAAYVYIKSGWLWVLQQKLVATGTNARMDDDSFGISVAISGETIVVGAHMQSYDDSGANFLENAGAAYVFTRSGVNWSQQAKLVATGTNARINYDNFGSNVRIDGETIVVGAPYQDYDGSGANLEDAAGAAYVFTRSGVDWLPQAKLVATGTNARMGNDNFGYGIGISGETIVVGAYSQGYDGNGANEVSGAGAAYVFTRSGMNWSQQAKLVATGTNARMNGDNFGSSVDISGETIVVGAYAQDYDDSGANLVNGAGAAYVFTRSGVNWSQQAKLVATGTNARMSDDNFGSKVSISGESIVVGAPSQSYDDSGANLVGGAGAAYVFTRSGMNWSSQAKLVATGTNARMASDNFGFSVVISGESIVVGAIYQSYDGSGANYLYGAGAAFGYTRSGSIWSQNTKVVDTLQPAPRTDLRDSQIGASVAISEDGTTMVAGAPYDNLDASGANYILHAGAAYVYIKSSGVWVFQQKLVATGTNARMEDDNFGISVGISGETIVVGARSQDYDASGANLMSDAGAAYVFTRSDGTWSQQTKLVGTGTNARRGSDIFGNSVGISGETIVVGAPWQDYDGSGANSKFGSGAAYVFIRSGVNWSLQDKLVATGTNARMIGDYFGFSVAISGESIVVGAPYQNYDPSGANELAGAGAAYVFTRSGVNWSQQAKLVATGTNARMSGDIFGTSVGISGESIVVGAEDQDYDGSGANLVNSAGAAYVFTRSGVNWSQQAKLVGTGTNARMSGDYFGSSIGISGETIVVGALSQDYDGSGANLVGGGGAAYVFARSGVDWLPQAKLVGTGINARIAEDHFGSSVAISENAAADGYTLGVGASAQSYSSTGDNPSAGAGAVFVYH